MVKKYFECSFSKIYPPKFGLNTPWPLEEPSPYPCEKGVWNWVNVRDPATIPNGGTIRLIPDPSDLTRACAEFIMDCQGTRPLQYDQHTKLYEVQERQAYNYAGVEVNKEEYFNLNYFAPADIIVRNWRMLWQMNGEAGVYGQEPPVGTPGPQLALYFYAPQYGGQLMFVINRFYYADNVDREFALMPVSAFPKNRWVPITVYMKQGSGFRVPDGTVIIWIDNIKVFERHDLPTSTKSGTPYEIWSIANYGGPEEEYGQTMYFKDIIVANERITTPVGPTHTLTLATTPINGVPILVNGTQHATPTTAVVGETPATVVSAPSSFTSAGQEYSFLHWEDGSTNPTRTLNVTSDMTLTAIFIRTTRTLIITSTANGTTDPTPATYEAAVNSLVQVSAIPYSGYMLDHWELDGISVGDNTPYSITMSADHIILAVFVVVPPPPPSKHNLTITATVGGTTNPALGVWEFNEGMSVLVQAKPDNDYSFDHWELGGVISKDNPVTVIMNTDHTLHAVFKEKPVPISLWKVATVATTLIAVGGIGAAAR